MKSQLLAEIKVFLQLCADLKIGYYLAIGRVVKLNLKHLTLMLASWTGSQWGAWSMCAMDAPGSYASELW